MERQLEDPKHVARWIYFECAVLALWKDHPYAIWLNALKDDTAGEGPSSREQREFLAPPLNLRLNYAEWLSGKVDLPGVPPRMFAAGTCTSYINVIGSYCARFGKPLVQSKHMRDWRKSLRNGPDKKPPADSAISFDVEEYLPKLADQILYHLPYDARYQAQSASRSNSSPARSPFPFSSLVSIKAARVVWRRTLRAGC